MTRRPKDGTVRHIYHRGPQVPPRFSPAFIQEVRACEDVEAFVELMERRGLWLNRNAAEGVFEYLCSLGEGTLSDDDLSGISGGLPGTASPSDPAVASALDSLLDQLSQR